MSGKSSPGVPSVLTRPIFISTPVGASDAGAVVSVAAAAVVSVAAVAVVSLLSSLSLDPPHAANVRLATASRAITCTPRCTFRTDDPYT